MIRNGPGWEKDKILASFAATDCVVILNRSQACHHKCVVCGISMLTCNSSEGCGGVGQGSVIGRRERQDELVSPAQSPGD